MTVPGISGELSLPSTGQLISIGEKFTIHSKVLDEDRSYWVYLPNSYDHHQPFANMSYPVIYLLDGDSFFATVSGLLRFMSEGINFNFQIPPHIIIAIPHADRMRDLTPTHHKDFATSGGGPDFLRFLEKELVPHIDASYRTLPFRVLVGHSLGGLCTLNAMMAPDPAFQAFMAIDSAVWWDNDLVLARAKADPSPKKPLNSTIYLAWSGVPNPAPKTARAFSSIVKANTARGYRTESQVIPAEDHGSVPLISLYQGLQFIYDGYRPDLRNFEAHPAAITAHYQRVSNRIHSRLLPPEEIVHRVGAHVQPEQALGYFQLNVENYPGSVHAWEALAEACLAKGDRQQANTNYEKALQLDPDNPKIKAALDKVKGDAHN